MAVSCSCSLTRNGSTITATGGFTFTGGGTVTAWGFTCCGGGGGYHAAGSWSGSGTYTGTKCTTNTCKSYITYIYNGQTFTVYSSTASVTYPAEATVYTTVAASNITLTGATSGGQGVGACFGTVSAKGVCWSTLNPPIISDSHTTNGSGTADYTSTITGLQENTLYYVRAYATNQYGTGYGPVISFTTASRPTVSTQAVSSITYSGATGNGTVTAQGTSAVTDRGICWSTSQNPTIANSHVHSGSGTGSFTATITGLTQHTLYYVRAFATNSYGTNYGTQVSFTSAIKAPVLTGGTDTHSFPLIGWSGESNSTVWGAATAIRWYNKKSTDANYTLIDTVNLPTLTKSYLVLSPNTSYSFYCTYYGGGVESPASNVVTINNAVNPPTATYSSILIV